MRHNNLSNQPNRPKLTQSDKTHQESEAIIYAKRSALHDIVVLRKGSHIYLKFIDPTSDEIMTRMDTRRPLYLLAPYTQAMMLGVLWRLDPSAIYVLGLGGGRIPMILRHCYPEATIESTEIDHEVVKIALQFFGLTIDSRLRVVVEDGRDYIARRPVTKKYDIVMVDAFRGTGYGPYHLATREFYTLCRSHLSHDGVVVVNLLPNDFLYNEKLATLAMSFKVIFRVQVPGTDILFASDNTDLDVTALKARATLVQSRCNFPFPFEQHAQNLERLFFKEDLAGSVVNTVNTTHILHDNKLPSTFYNEVSTESTVFKKVRRNDPCPCGSGRKFKLCHGAGDRGAFEKGETTGP